MLLTPETRIRIDYPDYPADAPDECKWADMVRDNEPETVADIQSQIEKSGFATVGGGAELFVRIQPI